MDGNNLDKENILLGPYDSKPLHETYNTEHTPDNTDRTTGCNKNNFVNENTNDYSTQFPHEYVQSDWNAQATCYPNISTRNSYHKAQRRIPSIPLFIPELHYKNPRESDLNEPVESPPGQVNLTETLEHTSEPYKNNSPNAEETLKTICPILASKRVPNYVPRGRNSHALLASERVAAGFVQINDIASMEVGSNRKDRPKLASNERKILPTFRRI